MAADFLWRTASAVTESAWNVRSTFKPANLPPQWKRAYTAASASTIPCDEDSPSANCKARASSAITGEANAPRTLPFTIRTAPSPSGDASVRMVALAVARLFRLTLLVGLSRTVARICKSVSLARSNRLTGKRNSLTLLSVRFGGVSPPRRSWVLPLGLSELRRRYAPATAFWARLPPTNWSFQWWTVAPLWVPFLWTPSPPVWSAKELLWESEQHLVPADEPETQACPGDLRTSLSFLDAYLQSQCCHRVNYEG